MLAGGASLQAAPSQLHSSGNQILNTSNQPVRLTGVNVPSLEWGSGENITASVAQALGVWKCNIIRLPLDESSWAEGNAYAATVDAVVNQVSAAGAYVILDNHGYYRARAADTAFWTAMANHTLYKNNPAVLFGLFNEPHDITWDIWRDGDVDGPGLQDLLTTVRNAGANNLLVVGGLKYAADISGVLTGGYALTDTGSGNGILYDMHIYPWHGSGGWAAAGRTLPILIGECGHDGSDNGGTGTSFGGNSPLLYWQMMNGLNALNQNFTGWSFHPRGGPSLILDQASAYTPASFSGQFVLNNLLSLRDASHESTVLNKGFETPLTSTFVYRPTGANWTFVGNAGIQKTWGAAVTPGVQTAFLQTAAATDSGANSINGSMSQTLNFDATGTYSISFLLAQRSGKTVLPITVSVDGVPISSVAYTPTAAYGLNVFMPTVTAPFTINSTGNHTIKLEATAAAGVDNETLIDNVTVAATGSAFIKDEGFQTKDLASNGTFAYRPTGGQWTFAGNAGVERNALGAPTNAPVGAGTHSSSGRQGAFLQTAAATDAGENNIDGTITQDIEFAAPGAYKIAFKAASRSGKGNLPIQVLVEGTLVGTVTPTTTAWADYSTPVFAIYSPGSYTVQLAATPSATVDNEAFIDGVLVTVPAAGFTRPTPVPVGDAGFERTSPALVHGAQPVGTAWTYTGQSTDPFYAGVQSDGSSFSNYDVHHAPEGWQTAFFKSNGTITGTISQAINFPSSGEYVLNFQSQAERGGAEPITIKVDGVVIGTHTPAHKAFYPHTTAPFTVTAGNHTILFAGGTVTGSAIGTFIDAVNIWPAGPAAAEIIVDNDDATGVTPTGTWTPSTYTTGFYDTNYIHDGNTGKGTKSFRFTPTLPTAGSYEVFTRWIAGSNRSSSVPVSIVTSTGTVATTVNEQINNGVWVSLGVYSFNAGTAGSVLISNTGTTGFVVADAVKFVLQTPTEIIVDNDDETGVTPTGTWTPSTYTTGFYDTNYIHDGNTGKGTKSFRFTPTLPAAGSYEVFTRWIAGSDRSSSVPVSIVTSTGTVATTVNEQLDNGVWVSLGVYSFDAGTGGSVLISNTGTTGFVVADAVKFVERP
ncbi:MAG: cellulase family glycosylhydrolase [Opitutaceae bacterium]|jgi:hypothetical protein